jgi:hypothetical protein
MPHGGYCIDPGDPSDCAANSQCMEFISEAAKAEFDAQPDRFRVEVEGCPRKLFKTQNQVDFYIRDLPHRLKSKVKVMSLAQQ